MSKIEDAVCRKIQDRAAAGVIKYGVSMERGDLSRLDWLSHLQQELIDGLAYIEKLIQDESDQQRTPLPACSESESLPWEKHLQARWAMKDSEGFVRMANGADQPVTIGQFWFVKGGTYILGIGAHIPGPWTESLRKRPEGV